MEQVATDRETITLRGHHLVNLKFYIYQRDKPGATHSDVLVDTLYRFRGGGYDYHTLQHQEEVLKRIYRGVERVKIVDSLDDFCAGCNLRDSLMCEKDPDGFSREVDRRYVEDVFGFEIGKEYSSEEVVQRLRTHNRYDYPEMGLLISSIHGTPKIFVKTLKKGIIALAYK